MQFKEWCENKFLKTRRAYHPGVVINCHYINECVPHLTPVYLGRTCFAQCLCVKPVLIPVSI